ncbi:predicted protein [Arabidopsis lyrata subsp. lyrata]|uniref:Predicted protein n=1 Tax=Arabidopsis lyrata subsp. lyrata TaxID=81972 RepID=D7MLI7_ARALL|nr:predicted protein [Arabidopsis lyrata subsp. lyrata]
MASGGELGFSGSGREREEKRESREVRIENETKRRWWKSLASLNSHVVAVASLDGGGGAKPE